MAIRRRMSVYGVRKTHFDNIDFLYAPVAQLVAQLICQSNSVKIIMELTSKQKGNLTELQCITAFTAEGCGVSIPYGDNSKYDFIADVNGKLLKIQVKTSSLKDENSIKFSCRTTHVNCTGVKNERYSINDIDFFATYWNGECYLIPIAECSVEKTLRFAPPKSGQIKGICFAKNYLLATQLQKVKEVSS